MNENPAPEAGSELAAARPTTSARLALAAKILVGLAGLALLLRLGSNLGEQVPRFAEWVDELGVWGPVVFVLGYALATVAFIPGLILTMAAGAIFGLAKGTFLVFLGASLGATASFLIARYLARGAIESRLESKPRFRAIDRAVGREGLKVTFLMRLSPVFPYNLLNYALGLTKVRLRDYVLACFGMIPGTFLYVYLGAAIGSLAAIAGGERGDGGPARWVLLGVGLAATIVVTAIVTRIARQALAKEVQDG